MSNKHDRFRYETAYLRNAVLLLATLLLLPPGVPVAQADDGALSGSTAVTAPDSTPAPIDVVFCMVADNAPWLFAPPVVAGLARRVILQNPGHLVRFGIVTYRSFDSDLQLDLTENQDQFLSVLSHWHRGREFSSLPVEEQLKSAMDHLTWSKDPCAIRKVYIVASGANDVANTHTTSWLVGESPEVAASQGSYKVVFNGIFQTLKETGSTIPVAPGFDLSVTEYTPFVQEFASSLPQHRATVSMVYMGYPWMPTGIASPDGNDTATVSGWFDQGWPFREGWVEDAKRGGGEFVQYIMPGGGPGPYDSPLLMRAVLWDHPEDFRTACRSFMSTMDARYKIDQARLAVQQIRAAKAEKAGFTLYIDQDPVRPVVRFFQENPQLHGVIIPE